MYNWSSTIPQYIAVLRYASDWQQKVNVLNWPLRSLDYSLMESLWRILVCKIYAHNKQYESNDKLCESILKACDETEKPTVINLTKRMPFQIYDIIRHHGHPCNY